MGSHLIITEVGKNIATYKISYMHINLLLMGKYHICCYYNMKASLKAITEVSLILIGKTMPLSKNEAYNTCVYYVSSFFWIT